MTVAMRITAGVVLVISAAAEIRAQTVELFESREHHSTEGRFEGRSFKYRLFVPRSITPGRRYPLLIWIHGKGDGGTNNVGQLKWIDLMLDEPAHAEKYRFFVLAVQCPMDLPWFDQTAAADGSPDDMLTVMTDILRETMLSNPVDRDRISLIGISSGASAAWEMAMRHPRLFAALVPLACASGSDESRAARLVKIPIWAFINNGERKGVESMVNAVQAAGGNAYLTVADAYGHDAWSTPLRGGILEWILAQRRGAFCWTPPGHDPWQWWHVLTLPLAFLAFLRVAWALEQRRRFRIMKSKANKDLSTSDFPF